MNTILNSALTLTYNQLSTFSGLDNFWQVFDTAFSTQYNRSGAEILRLQWLSSDFSQLPQIEILDNSTLGNANGAYATSTNRIYLSANFIATSTLEAISAVLLEEIGHFIDAQINQIDTPGDEGEKFSALVRGQNLTTQELDRINTENDWANITVEGKVIAVEQAAPIVLTVTTTADQNDGSATGGLSLRDAILIANADTTNDYIIELQGGQTYSLSIKNTASLNGGGDEQAGVRGDLDILAGGKITIKSVGYQKAIIDATNLKTSFTSGFGDSAIDVKANAYLILNGVTITGASIGAVWINPNSTAEISNSLITNNEITSTSVGNNATDAYGGGIKNYGTLLLKDSTISNNQAVSNTSNNSIAIVGNGGGIFNAGMATITNTAIIDNTSRFGGGISNRGTVSITNTTISGNRTNQSGGGIFNSNDVGTSSTVRGKIYLNNSTITNNTADFDSDNNGIGGGILNINGYGEVYAKNTIIAGNFQTSNKGGGDSGVNYSPDIYGPINGNNYNLIGNKTGSSGTIGTGTDIVNPNPGLRTLQYIGNTYIHPLLAGSPAINAGNNSLIPTDTQDLDSDQNTTEIIPFDQRNLLRIFGTTVDIGAVEMSNGSGTNILPEVEGNNTFATAQVIATTSFNRQVVADIQDFNGSNISTTYDHVSILGTGDGTFDLYRFNALANTQLVFDIDNNNFDTILRLWNPNNNQLLSSNDDGIETGNTGNDTASFFTYKTLTTSDYIIGVYRYSSSALTPPATGDSYTLHLSMLNDAVFTPIESAGNTTFLKDAANKYFTQVGTATPIAIKAGGQQIYQDIYAGWQTLAAETVNGDNQVLWKNVSGNFLHIWHLDSNWNWVSAEGNWGLNSAEALTQETKFGIDTNGDGKIGYAIIELAGNTTFLKDAANKYFTQVGTATPIAIKAGGQQIYQDIYAGWQTLAAETVNGDNQVLWKNVSGNFLHIWHAD